MKRTTLLSWVLGGFAVFWGGGAAADCLGEAKPDGSFLEIIRNAAKEDSADASAPQGNAAERRLKVDLIDRLLSIGDGRGALAFALHEDGLAVSPAKLDLIDRPAEVLAALRAIRFVGNSFDGVTEIGAAESDQVVWRQTCFNEGAQIVGMLIGHIQQEIERSDDEQAASSMEALLGLLAIFKIEEAELQRDIGDYLFRTISLEDLPPRGRRLIDEGAGPETGKAQVAMTHYRDAQSALAAALGFAQERDVARIRLAADDLQIRMDWLREGLAFGGGSYELPTRPIGYSPDSDPLGFTILKSLSENMGKLDAAQKVLERQKAAALTALKEDFLAFATSHARAEAHKHVQLQALFAELGRLEGVDIAELRVSSAREAQGDAASSAALDSLRIQEQNEIKGRRDAAARTLLDSLPALAAQIAALAELGPLRVDASPLSVQMPELPEMPKSDDPYWREDAALFGRVFGACGETLTSEARPDLSRSWSALQATAQNGASFAGDLERAPDVWLAEINEALGPAMVSAHAAELQSQHARLVNAMTMLKEVGRTDSKEAAMAQSWQSAMRECWSLATQLQIERAMLLNTRLDLQARHAKDLADLAREEIEKTSEALIRRAEAGGENVAEEMSQRLRDLRVGVLDAAKKQAEAKIAHTQKLLGEAQKIVDQVIRTGKNVQGAITAAKGVYSSLTGVPVGSGPGGVHFERSTLVAMTNSAVEMARFTYRATNDVMEIKRQLNALEGQLRDYVEDLQSISWKRTEEDIKAELERAKDGALAAAKRILDDTRSAIIDDLEASRRRLENEAREMLDSVVLESDSRASLIEQQLDEVFARLQRLKQEREALGARQTYALQALLYEMTQTVEQARTVRGVQEELRAAELRQAEAQEEIRRRQENVLQALRDQDASLAQRVQEILEEIRKIRSGEAENAWSGARRLAAGFLSPPRGLNAEALKSNIRVRRALDAVGDDIFELAIAVKSLTQGKSVLSFAVRPASADEAEQLRDKLVDLYKIHVEGSLRVSPTVVALRITPEIARSWGRTPSGPNGELEYPRCLNAQTSEADPRCLRIATSFQRLREASDEASGLEARQSRHCSQARRITEILKGGGPQNEARVFWPVNAAALISNGRPSLAAMDSRYCSEDSPPGPEAFEQPDAMGELVFHLDSMLQQQGEHPLLVDVLVATTSAAVGVLHPTNLIPVGATREVCRLQGDVFQERLIELPFTTRYQTHQGPKPSPSVLLPGEAGVEFGQMLDNIYNKPMDEFFGIGAVGRRQLFYGRGMANNFEIQMPSTKAGANQPSVVQDLSEEIYLFLVFVKFECKGSDSGAVEVIAEPPYASDFNRLLNAEALQKAPTARALLRLEQGLANEDGTTRSSRLAVIEQSLDLARALARPSNGDAREELGRRTVRDEWSAYEKDLPQALPTLRPQNMEALFQCALEGAEDCRLMLKDDEEEVANFKAHPVDRPIPIQNFDALIRLAMENPEKRDELGPLPREFQHKIEELGETRELLGQAIEFLDRSTTTLRTFNLLERQAENRLSFLRDATAMLRAGAQSYPAGLNELLCADFFLSESGFWLLQRNEGRLNDQSKLLGSLRSFNAYCRFGSSDAAKCEEIQIPNAPKASSMEGGPDQGLEIARQCAQKFGLSYEDAAAFSRAFSFARDLSVSTPE